MEEDNLMKPITLDMIRREIENNVGKRVRLTADRGRKRIVTK